MIPFSKKEEKRFIAHLINSRVVYKYCDYDKTIPNYIEYLVELIEFDNKSRYYHDKNISAIKKCYQMIKNHEMTDADINVFISTIKNPREEWRQTMREHNNGGRETRDNKGQFVSMYVYCKPVRYLNGNISRCRRNIIRYPKKCRSLRTWKKFYEMFPKQAEIDGWDGKTSNKMK